MDRYGPRNKFYPSGADAGSGCVGACVVSICVRVCDQAGTLSIKEIQEDIGIGGKSKTLVLLLTHLSWLKTIKIDGHIVYAVCARA